jgi:hypothetical protein
MKSPGPRVLVRFALAALAVLVLVGWIQSTAPSAPLVMAGADEIGAFAVVDMGDAIGRAVGAHRTPQSD